MARATSWWPRQMPRIGSGRDVPRAAAASRSVRVVAAICGMAAGSPGPLEMTIPSGDHERFGPWPAALGRPIECPVVADERVGQNDDLSVVGSVGRDLLISGHRRVEYDLTRRRGAVTEGLSPPRRAVFQPEDRRPAHGCITIRS